MTYIQSFAGVEAPDFFYTKKVPIRVMPPTEIKTIPIPNGDGEYYVGKKYTSDTIPVECFIKAPDRKGVMYVAEELSKWLATEGPQPLIFSDKPDRVYYGIIQGATSLDKLVNLGQGTITFFLPDPFSYGPAKLLNLQPNTTNTIVNEGTAESFARFNLTFKKNSSYLSIVSPDGIVMLGNPKTPDKTTIPKYKTVLSDDMSAVSRWTAAASDRVDGDTVQGSFVSNGYSFQVTDYGTEPTSGNGWFGPAMRRDLSETATDFEATIKLGLASTDFAEMGRIEAYFYDINGVRLGKVQIKDTFESYEANQVEGWIGDGRQSQIGKMVLDIKGTRPAPKVVSQKVNGKTVKKTVYPTAYGQYNDFKGYLYFRREGTKYQLQVGREEADGTRHTRTTVTYDDKAKKYPKGALAYVVVHMAKYQGHATPKKGFYIEDVKVTKLQKGGTTYNEDIINAGDVVTVDMASGEVTCNGADFQAELDIASKFFGFDGNTETEIKILSEDNTATINATLNERFL
jgi:predicted phage tail component-like protein